MPLFYFNQLLYVSCSLHKKLFKNYIIKKKPIEKNNEIIYLIDNEKKSKEFFQKS